MASGSIAKHFITWIAKKRVAQNHYYVTDYKKGTLPEKLSKNITLVPIDPTSFSKLSHTMKKTKFSHIFVILEDKTDAEYTLKNIALINPNARTILVNQWHDENMGKMCKNITIIHQDQFIANHLYEQLPNVPLVAQNVGLGQGEIMEVHVPFGSSYAYRHIGSIVQRKWKIAALYRGEMQILPTAATMIRPNDTLLILGKPLVLDGIYKTVNKRTGLFPEPFGKDIYLMIDMRFDKKNALAYLEESIYLLTKLENKSLFVRIFYPNDFNILKKLRKYESTQVDISISYKNDHIQEQIEHDIDAYDIGLILTSRETFKARKNKESLYRLKKLVYLFGDKYLYDVKQCVILMSENEKMESISTTAFDISESLDLNLLLGDYDPDGEFEERNIIMEHFQTLSEIFNREIDIRQKISNPIRELSGMHNILQVMPFEKNPDTNNLFRLLSVKIYQTLLHTNKHPKLLVPYEPNESKEEGYL